jgi:hypothetical protein
MDPAPVAPVAPAAPDPDINPEFALLPAKLPRYRYPGHPHRMYCVKGVSDAECDNRVCRHSFNSSDVCFYCVRCDFQLCINCFKTMPEITVPLTDDHLIDDNIRIRRPRFTSDSVPDTLHVDDVVLYESIPSVPTIDDRCPICFETYQLLQLGCMHVCCYSCYGNIRNCGVCRQPIDKALTKRLPAQEAQAQVS